MSTTTQSPAVGDLVRAFGQRLPLLDLGPGPWDPASIGTDGHGLAVMVVDGLMVRDVQLDSVITSELLGPGDVFEAGPDPDALLSQSESFEVPEAATIAVVGALSADALAREPGVALRVLRAAANRTRRQLRHRAAVQLPRVEDRVLAVLWLVAERHGRVVGDGVDVGVALRHEVIGRLVGARRPTVTTALSCLSETGTVRRSEDRKRLVLDPASRRSLAPREHRVVR